MFSAILNKVADLKSSSRTPQQPSRHFSVLPWCFPTWVTLPDTRRSRITGLQRDQPGKVDVLSIFLYDFAGTTDHCNVGKVTIEMLPEEILLEVFFFYLCGTVYDNNNRGRLVHVLPEVEIHRLCSTTPPEPATCLRTWSARKNDVGYLATVAHLRVGGGPIW